MLAKRYHLSCSDRETFPVRCDEIVSPDGFDVEVFYRKEDGKPSRVLVYGYVESVEEIKDASKIEKILKFIENQLKEQATEQRRTSNI